MKYLALFMVLVTLLVVGYGIHLFLNANVAVLKVEVSSQRTEEAQEMLQADIAAIQSNSFAGRLFHNVIDPSEEYYYVTYTIHVQNNLHVDIDAIETQVLPKNGDVFQRHNTDFVSIAKHSSGEIRATVLSKKSTLGVREFVITYYVWGVPFVLRHTYG